MPEITQTQAMRYSRQIMLDNFDLEGQEAVLESSALIIGLGGLGCAAAPYLVSSGIGKVTLVDDDIVSHSNLSRQLMYREHQVDTLKTHATAQYLQALNADCDIRCIDQQLDDGALQAQIAQHDIVLDCTDNLATRQQINRLCYRSQRPLVIGSAIRMEGQLFSTYSASQKACYHCYSQFFEEPHLSCAEAGVLSPLVGVVGAMQATEALKILSSSGSASYGTLHLFDARLTQWQSFQVPKHPHCPICQSEENP